MKLDILTVIILLCYLYIMVCVLKTNNNFEMGLLTACLLLYLYIKNKNDKVEGYNLNAETYAPAGGCIGDTCTKSEVSDVVNKIQEDVEQDSNKTSIPTTVHSKESDKNQRMSNFDGLCLNTGNTDSWMKSPSDIQLSDMKGLYTIQGGTAPVKPVFSDMSSLIGPPIDGQDNSPKSLFMLGNNKVSPECCPSTFSTSTGCLCSTHNQREYIKNRGNNVTSCDK